MRTWILAVVVAALAPSARAAEGKAKVKTLTPAQTVSALVRFVPPKGWTASDYANSEGADPVVRYESLSDALVVRVFGAPGSSYASVAEFLAGPAATTQGAAPAADGKLETGAGKLSIYKRKYPINIPDPHGPPAPLMLGTEKFAVLPLPGGKRFAVISWQRASPAPDLEGKGEKAWLEFAKTVKPAAKAKKKD